MIHLPLSLRNWKNPERPVAAAISIVHQHEYRPAGKHLILLKNSVFKIASFLFAICR